MARLGGWFVRDLLALFLVIGVFAGIVRVIRMLGER